MDTSLLKFDLSNEEEYARECFYVISQIEPFPDDYYEHRSYDGQEYTDDDREISTLAKYWLEDNGYINNQKDSKELMKMAKQWLNHNGYPRSIKSDVNSNNVNSN